MSDVSAGGVWVPVVFSLLLAVALPVIVSWRLSAELMREKWLYSRRGSVVTTCIVIAVSLVFFGGFMGVAAVAHPFLWSTVAMIAGALVAVFIVLVRYMRQRPRP
jgi:hypothetical protein